MSEVRCTNSYSDVTAETSDYAPGWIPLTWIHGYNVSIPWSSRTLLQRAFLFTPPTGNQYFFGGKIATYPGGGYVADLTDHADQASSLIRDLEASQWVDEYTRAVLVEFNVLNPNSKLFNQVILIFEYTPDGSTLWTTNVNVVQLYYYYYTYHCDYYKHKAAMDDKMKGKSSTQLHIFHQNADIMPLFT